MKTHGGLEVSTYEVEFLSLPSACGRAELLRTQITLAKMELIFLTNELFVLLCIVSRYAMQTN